MVQAVVGTLVRVAELREAIERAIERQPALL
jgi:hypothetical protein